MEQPDAGARSEICSSPRRSIQRINLAMTGKVHEKIPAVRYSAEAETLHQKQNESCADAIPAR
jgi:hypothetical protein